MALFRHARMDGQAYVFVEERFRHGALAFRVAQLAIDRGEMNGHVMRPYLDALRGVKLPHKVFLVQAEIRLHQNAVDVEHMLYLR